MWFLFLIANGAPAANIHGDGATWINVSVETHITLHAYRSEVCVGAREQTGWAYSNSSVDVGKNNQMMPSDPGWNAWTA